MKANEFKDWFKRSTAIWQGEQDYPVWEVTDGNKGVWMALEDGYKMLESDIELTEEQASHVFDYVMENELERLNDAERDTYFFGENEFDDNEHGLYGYGY